MREIYVITNTVTEQWYIGCSHDAKNRFKRHIQLAHSDSELPLHINIREHGEFNFTMQALERCENEIAGDREKYWIAYFMEKMPDKKLNNRDGGCGSISDEARAKLSAAQIGNQNALGYKHSEEARAKMSAAQIGNQNALGHKCTDEAREKMSAAQSGENNPNFGKHRSEETKMKMRASYEANALRRMKIALENKAKEAER